MVLHDIVVHTTKGSRKARGERETNGHRLTVPQLIGPRRNANFSKA